MMNIYQRRKDENSHYQTKCMAIPYIITVVLNERA